MIHALIADDHAVVRRGLKELLTDSGRIAVEGEAGTARETLEKVRERDWDVLILDINLPDRSGLDILREMKLSVKTISTYRGRVLDKMGMRTNAELTYYAVRNQLVD